ncbi:MAG: hypothetical protein C0467_04425 [Planctomycetaceae bacterium]|nr:hypothetical protein [Planctomycetaceae bacterium]
MWRSMRRWIDWVLDELLPLVRTRRSGFTVHVGYDAGGQTHAQVPVPWSAEAVVVEVVLRLPLVARRKSDFTLRVPNSSPLIAESIRPDTDERHRITFRAPVPGHATVAEFQWKSQPVATIPIPVLTVNEFLSGLTLTNTTVVVRLGAQSLPTQSFVVEGCKGLVASTVLQSTHPLVPLTDLGLSVEFTNERTGNVYSASVPLTAAQRASMHTVVTVVCPRVPRRPGSWRVVWKAGARVLAATRVEAIAARRFENGVRLLDTRFAVADDGDPLRLVRIPPSLGAHTRMGPCFLVSGTEAGAAGLCRLAVFAVLPGVAPAAQLLEELVLITDAPTVFAPGLVESADLTRISAFELRLNGRVLGTVALSPVPHATLTAEGGFKPPQDFDWSAAAEDNLLKRLGQLGGQ